MSQKDERDGDEAAAESARGGGSSRRYPQGKGVFGDGDDEKNVNIEVLNYNLP